MPEKPLSKDPIDIANTLTWTDFSPENVLKMPCARKSLFYGLMGGLSLGIVRFYVTKQAVTALNWGVGSFGGISLLNWEWCRYQRRIIQLQLDAIDRETREKLEATSLEETK